tara:strand:+ start:5765 stop:6361 length:597 start_codon:yes stop_codon:yes gene_type:complete
MCDALTIAAIGMQTMGALESNRAQGKAYEANAAAANQAKIDEDRMINLQQAQEEEKAAQQRIATDLQTQQTASRAQVAAGQTGGFLNNNAVMQDIMRQGLAANTVTSQNLDRTVSQLGEERAGAMNRAQSRINSVARPSRTATMLQIGASAASTAAMAGYGGADSAADAGAKTSGSNAVNMKGGSGKPVGSLYTDNRK